MKKIIAAFDGLKFSQSTLDYSINMAKQTNAYLAGVFLDDFTYTSYKIYDLVGKEGVTEQQLKDYTEKDDQDDRYYHINAANAAHKVSTGLLGKGHLLNE